MTRTEIKGLFIRNSEKYTFTVHVLSQISICVLYRMISKLLTQLVVNLEVGSVFLFLKADVSCSVLWYKWLIKSKMVKWLCLTIMLFCPDRRIF